MLLLQSTSSLVILTLKHCPLYGREEEREDHPRAVLMLHKPHLRFSDLETFADEHANDALGSPGEGDRPWSEICEQWFRVGNYREHAHFAYDSDNLFGGKSVLLPPESC
ncbi:hypothetical protein E4U30_001863 [Claviceps sp. LM220 group G6]|nr:hypothetical protein E4U30_001863 [Claviceps sp. LM220 group G6]